MAMSANAVIDKTFFNSTNNSNTKANIQDRKTHKRGSKTKSKSGTNNNYDFETHFPSKILKRKKDEDFDILFNSNPNNGRHSSIKGNTKTEQSCSNILCLPQHQQTEKDKSNKADHSESPSNRTRNKNNNNNAAESKQQVIDRASKTSNLNPRKLNKQNNGSSDNMILKIPGLYPNLSKLVPSPKHSRRSNNTSQIDMKSSRKENENDAMSNQGSNVNVEINANNVIGDLNRSIGKPIKILIPQSDKLKEFDEELRKEEKQLAINSNVNEVNIQGKRKTKFLFDTLKIQKLNSIKELGAKNMENEHKQSIVLYKDIKGEKLNLDKIQIKQQNEKNIIIINHNYSSSFSNNSAKKVKGKMFCCIPVK